MREGRLWRETSFDLGAKLWQVNWLYVLLLCALAGVGYAALFSAAGGAPEPYASRHVLRFATGLVLMIGIALVDIRFIARLAWPSYFVCAGAAGGGDALRPCRQGRAALDRARRACSCSRRELMKIALVLALASWFHRASWERIGNPLFLIPPVLAVLVPVGLIVKEPNLGTAVITALLGAAMFFAAGVRWWKFVLVALPVPFAGALRLRPSARLPAGPHRHLPASRERSAGRRLQHHPVEDRAGLGRHVGQGLPARHAGASGFPAGEADRLHLHHDRRGVRLRRRRRGDGAAGA